MVSYNLVPHFCSRFPVVEGVQQEWSLLYYVAFFVWVPAIWAQRDLTGIAEIDEIDSVVLSQAG